MSQTLVFYAGNLIAAYEGRLATVDTTATPEGSYAYSTFSTGWFQFNHGWQSMNAVDVPKDIRLMAHLINQ